MFNTNIYNYRVCIINHETGEICEQYYNDLDYAKTFYTGVTVTLGIVWNSDCEYYIEHRIGDDEWERVPDDEDDEDEDEWTDEDEEFFEKYFINSGNTTIDWCGF